MRYIRKLKYPLIIISIIALFVWVAAVNGKVTDDLKAQGEDYNVGVATVNPKDGKNGESAYEIAVRNGFEGSEQEWLLSLIGLTGESIRGENGLSAYQIAVLNGFTGSQAEWLASLKGEKGDAIKGDKGDTVVGQNGLTPPCYFEASQCRGANGDSIKGDNGQPPTSWRFTYLETEYECKRTDPFDPANPTYTCEPYNPEEGV